ncbi:uncharacterized protein F4817DRAFT_350036 [Daldinia loculata]|uniref:uncharacterized protein n=1 Tax=Daldinia loculata TaxID=103429 RepID=UPI0020C28E78|nr:uncharacterized protein F4817DRAFT_350036 [Daldinia loculata]KAI1643345.1 hypothetical protein F4817DRAFT_350036 [Daldinia loculata]
MDGLYFDTFGECPIDSSIPTDVQSGYSSCSEAEDTPCPRCLRTRGKLCRKCKLRLHAHGDAKGNTKSSLELVSGKKSNISDDYTAGQYLESFGLSKFKMPHRLSSDNPPTKHDEPAEVSGEETSHYMMWGENSLRGCKRRTNRDLGYKKYQGWEHVDYVESSYSRYQEWNRNGTQERSYSKYEEWHQRDYRECWRNQHEYRPKRYRERIYFIQGRALQPCQIRSIKPGVDRDEPRYMAEIWQYTSGKRASSTRLVLYGLQSCGILTLPYGSRVYAQQRKLYLETPTSYPWFILSRWAIGACVRIVAIAYALFWYRKFPDPVPEELD